MKVLGDYQSFIAGKAPGVQAVGIAGDVDIHPRLFDFQASCVAFALRQGRAGVFLDTGLGKTFVQLEFLRHALREGNGRALLMSPLGVARQIEREAHAFGIEARVIRDRSEVSSGINICNYERMDRIDVDDFGAVSLDEASILKNYSGKTSRRLKDLFAGHRFRMVATATPAPNDHMELGQYCEFLGIMSSNEMLSRWFITDQTEMGRYRLKRHSVAAFWDWMVSWSRLAQSPADMGFDGSRFALPALRVHRHHVDAGVVRPEDGALFATAASATTLHVAKRQTIGARAVAAGELVAGGTEPWVVWCDTDYEADALRRAIPDAVEVRGSMPIERKEDNLDAFTSGQARVIITKPQIAGFGLNWQHCAKMLFAGRSFSYERYYQAVRRCWRFGQSRPVDVHLLLTHGEDQIARVIDRKAHDHAMMKAAMAEAMRRAMGRSNRVKALYRPEFESDLPRWLADGPDEKPTSANEGRLACSA